MTSEPFNREDWEVCLDRPEKGLRCDLCRRGILAEPFWVARPTKGEAQRAICRPCFKKLSDDDPALAAASSPLEPEGGIYSMPAMTAPATPWDVVRWLQSRGITPLPCQPKSKSPISQISRRGIYGDHAPKGDSFHVPTQERMAVVTRWWKNEEFHRHATVRDESISVPLHPGWNGGQQVIVLDIDDARLCDAVTNAPYLAQCPVSVGKKGAKAFAILDLADSAPDTPILQYVRKEDPDHPALEIFTGSKHALIYGEHPSSTLETPIFYAIARGFGDPFPILSWERIEQALEPVIRDNNLVLKTKAKPKRVQPMPARLCPGNTQSITDQLGLDVTTLCTPSDGVLMGDEIRGSHPVHGSTTGQNFTVSARTNAWHCFRCGTGGGPLEWIAVEAGIIDCSDAKPGCLDGHWPDVFDALHERGYNPDMLTTSRKEAWSALSPGERYLARVEHRRRMRAERHQEAQV